MQAAFEEFVSQGGGVYVWHSGNNAFSAWPAYNDMIGLGWRKKEFGPAIAIDEHEQLVRIPAGEGENTGHGARHDTVVHRLGDNPIHAGLPRAWKTPDLEVYYYARGPAKNLTVLSYGFDPKTKMNWPLEWVVTYGQGRVYTSTFGHVWKGDTEPVGMRCAGVQTILIRALQWLAHREVTWPVPPDFPTAEQISVRGEIPPPNSAIAQSPATVLQQQSGRDEHSVVADARFVDPAKGDYRVKEGSPALALGFENFPMDQFGVSSDRLRRLARTPELPFPGHARKEKSRRDSGVTVWLGARVKNIVGLGEVSAAGLPGETGVSVLEVPAGSAAAKAGLEVGDVILKCAGRTVHQMSDLERRWRAAAPGPVVLQVWRGQRALSVTVTKE